jgi:hypothetical protein
LFPGTAKGILPSPKYQEQLLGPKQLAFKRYRNGNLPGQNATIQIHLGVEG